MVPSNEIIIVNRKIWLHDSQKYNFEATITKLEEKMFWINLPLANKQPLSLRKKQPIKMKVTLETACYTGETLVEAIGKNIHQTYGLLLPTNLIVSEERYYKRAPFCHDVIFKTNLLMVPTKTIDFSPGGMQVYITPELNKILQSKDKIFACLHINGYNIQYEVRLVWKKLFYNLPVAGFEFIHADQLRRFIINSSFKTNYNTTK
ncbi:type IV pilus assembly PilZ [Desulfofarcimen acetoxidans DSM 771]|uniref:Type IV pilus assembly PilZ n=1 Tax=Desulfofarcimen acetoxidans (strain ATCC 49208 / DSM 771 / KCTC 5769 / VKM B-1644 / 5575) TaxID=485916 RepID=C8VW42_DESAS|nr:PilZ domain-containing protein [Desulfofarcimen acetoxidans]ACV64329.1 type IV pilus assembly PilZ [Desulfofarcimen acetoxidans DSM 771]